MCNNRMVRQDLLDQIVWTEVIRLLEDPTLIQQELDRRLAAARSSDPTKKREQSLQRELTRVGKSVERLLTAYQEELLSLEQLRERMPLLRQREQTLRAELQAIADQATDRATFLRLAETLAAFLGRLRDAADTLDIVERQRIVRLVVKDILIGDDAIVIRHCIPIGSAPPPQSGPATPGRAHDTSGGQSLLLRSGSTVAAAREHLHYVFDLWMQRWRRREARGDVIVVRYADDSVAGFESKADVERFLETLKVRFAKFGLSLNGEKTRVLEFGRFAAQHCAQRGLRRPQTFDFLGFTHICGVTRTNGRFTVLRLTSSKRMRATLKALRQTLKRRQHEPIPVIGKWLRRVIQGYFNYHAVPGNSWRLSTFRKEVGRAWLHALRRRGQHGRMPWARFMRYVARYVPLVRVLHPYPNQRFTS